MNKLYGIILCLAISFIAVYLSSYIVIGSVAIAIILGAIIGNIINIPNTFKSGITFSERTFLTIAISLLGINLDFNVLLDLGIQTIFIIVISMIATISFGIYLSKKLNFNKDFACILAIGNGVCGSAAIGATKDIVKLDKEKSALAIAIVNLLGTVGLFILPIIGVILGLNDTELGILLGNTLQSVGHAVAAGFSINELVGQNATITKMGRILLLTAVIFWLIWYSSKNSNIENTKKGIKLQVPLFVMGFVVFSIIATSGILPLNIVNIISQASKWFLLLSMSAIGLKISFNAIKQTGWDAFVIAGYIFKFQIVLSVVLIAVF